MREKRSPLELMTNLELKAREIAREANEKLIELVRNEKGEYNEEIHQLSILIFIRYFIDELIIGERSKVLKELFEKR